MNIINRFGFLLAVVASALITSCTTEDPGPVQEVEKQFALIDFDRLEMGSGLNINVTQGNNYNIMVKGDRRNIEDLNVRNVGNTLVIEYEDHGNRNHTTYVRITMPELKSVNFSGGSFSEVTGFESDQRLDFILSGGSFSQLNAGYRDVKIILSGGSKLRLYGLGDELNAEISGASELSAFDYPVRAARLNVSGASSGKVTVTDQLAAVAASASSVLYRGSPTVSSEVTGASTVRKD
ncbi:MAG: DUF2807 domain-containing protein [Chryseolinea sp.]